MGYPLKHFSKKGLMRAQFAKSFKQLNASNPSNTLRNIVKIMSNLWCQEDIFTHTTEKVAELLGSDYFIPTRDVSMSKTIAL